MSHSRRNIAVVYQVTVSLTILLSILLVYGIYRLGSNTTLAAGFSGSFFLFLAARPKLRHVSLALGSGAIVAVLYGILGGTFGKDSGIETLSLVTCIGAFLGAGSILAMSLDRVWTGSLKYAVPLNDALILPVFSLIAGLFMQFTNGGTHPSYDLYLYRFDSSLGLAPGQSVASLFRKLTWIRTASLWTYTALAIFPPVYLAWASYQGKRPKIHVLHAFMVAGVGGFALYHICPALGPIYAFGSQFPDQLPPVSTIPIKVFMSTGVNNAMPSLHMTWILLVWVAAWELGWVAVATASAFVVFTGLATLGFGEHYLIDLVVAAPLVKAVQGICTARHKLTATGLGLVIAWTVYLREGIQLPASLNWSFVIATIVTTVVMMGLKDWVPNLVPAIDRADSLSSPHSAPASIPSE